MQPDADPQASAPVQPGDILAGKYRVERVLGVGGMGVVVAAVHVHLGQRVALKFLLKDAAKRPEIVARFLREAQSAVRIQSEHVARVSDVGTLPDGAPYLVMEFLQGRDLAELLEKSGPLSVATVADYILQACEAIAEAHALGIVHRDLKPANLFLSRRADGSSLVKVIDFGISKSTAGGGPSGESLTATSGMLGSPYYMSPEQVKSAKQVDARTDIWALGVIVHELLTGRPPFVAQHLYGLMSAIDRDPAPPLRTIRPDVPREIEALVLRCLEKEPVLRWETIAAFAAALVPFAPPSGRISFERISRLSMGVSAGATQTPASDGEGPTVVMMPSAEMDAAMGKADAPRLVAAAATAEGIGTAPTVQAGHVSKSDLLPTAVSVPGAGVEIPGGTAAGWGGTRNDAVTAPAGKRGWLPAAVVGMVAVMGATWALVAIVLRDGSPARPDASVPARPPVEAPSNAPSAAASASAAPSASQARPETPVVDLDKLPPAQPGRPAVGGARPAATPTATGTVTAKKSCDPPYVIDGNGVKRYKPECVQ